MKKLKLLLAIGLIPVFLIINFIKSSSLIFEKYYSNFLYPIISEKLRFITGWVGFAVGDILYLSIIISLIYYLIFKKNKIDNKIINLGSSLFILTFLFYFLWGFNYKRVPIKDHLNISNNFDKGMLINFTDSLINEINIKHKQLFINDTVKPKNIYSFEENVKFSKENTEKLKNIFRKPFLESNYSKSSVKKSLFSLPLTYMGFSGYINPFTNEANINYKIPSTSLTFVINHEIAHQLGIASEKDANFISYIMLINSDNQYHKYCGLSYALRLCLNELYNIDYDIYQKLLKKINKGIIKDYVEINNFWKKYDGKIEDVSKKSYDLYLKQNNIKTGIRNYNESISLILNFNNRLNE